MQESGSGAGQGFTYHPGGEEVGGSRGYVRLLRILRLRGVRQDEGRLTRAQELELFPDLHLLLAGAVLEAFQAFAPQLVFALEAGVAFLEPTDFAAPFHERLQSLRSAKDDPAVGEQHSGRKRPARDPEFGGQVPL